jgi:serine/threonine protein kinase
MPQTRWFNDLVEDSRLNATILPNGRDTRHISYPQSDTPSGRPRAVEEIWRRKRDLGAAGNRRVWVEECVLGRVGECRAVKEIWKPSNERVSEKMSYQQELYALAKFSQPRYAHCFVKSHGWFDNDTCIYIVMEYLPYGDLQAWLDVPFPEHEAKNITAQLVDGLEFMHNNGFAHRDLKPPNILIASPRPEWWVKLADFGISKRIQESSALHTMHIGTSGFIAPEVMGIFHHDDDLDEEDISYTQKVDMWALGETVCRMMTAGCPTFESVKQLAKFVRGESFPTEKLHNVKASTTCCDFVEQAMAPSAKKRLSASEAKNHTWLETTSLSNQVGQEGTSTYDPVALIANQ